jgi:predicted metal-dependent enzyme (double-stranded beta helix superfamily)
VRQLVEGLRTIIGSVQGRAMDLATIGRIEGLVKESLPRLEDSCLCTKGYAPGRYLCYKDPDLGFVVMFFVWGPGNGTAIHDHGTWGVEAVLKNSLKITNYTSCEKNPQPTDSFVAEAGSLMHNLPPERDVHKVEHHSGDYAMSLHVYGKEMSGNRSFFPGEGFKVCKLECRELTKEFDFTDLTKASAGSQLGA